MKKYLLLLFIACVGLASCKKETFITEPLNRTILVDIAADKWVRSADGLEFTTVIDVPENNPNFNQAGHVIVSMSFEIADVYEALPQTYAGLTYRSIVRPGSVTLSIRDVNNSTGVIAPDGLVTAKITLIDAELID